MPIPGGAEKKPIQEGGQVYLLINANVMPDVFQA